MLPKAICFVDVETTGTSAKFGKIIEIGIIRVEGSRIVESFKSLVNPQTSVDPFILSMTGINLEELAVAPIFYQLKDQIRQLLKDSLFIAHNAIFDYSFIKTEFGRCEETFSSKYCCSVKLSKKLYPRFKRHNLDAIIKRFNLACKNRHRAFDDAKVIHDFYKLSLKKWGKEKFLQAFKTVMKRPSRPINISEEILDSLPENCGVYIFYSQDNTPLYIGKSKNIRDRVLSHFSNIQRENIDMKIAQNIHRVEAIETAGELGALLLEATLVKKMQPLYNRQLRYAYKLLAIKKQTNLDGYFSISETNLAEVPVDQLNQILGIFKSRKELKTFLINVSKEFNLCLKLLGVEKSKANCFNYHLDLCKGACSKKETFLKYNLRFEEAFYKTRIKQWPFKGPIALREKPAYQQAGSQKEELFVIDKWCVLGSIKNKADSLDDIKKEYLFDTDTYKILSHYLKGARDLEIFQISQIDRLTY